MSGSGSCVYGITKANLAGDIVQTMKKEFPQCEFFLSSTHA
jgi:4-diphosphocytidyl-2C-methyl-D-erythritol kinase